MRAILKTLVLSIATLALYTSAAFAVQPKPSYQQGYAVFAAESARPEDWVGLLGLWNPALGPTGLVLYDVGGHQFNADLTNMVSSSDWIVDSELGYVLDLDGSDDKIDFGTGPVPILSQPWTILIWAKHNTGSVSDDEPLVGFDTISTDNALFLAVDNKGGNDVYKLFSDGETPGDGALLDSDWHLHSIVYDGSAVSHYIDRDLDYSVTPTGTDWQGSVEFWVSEYNSDINLNWNGRVSQVRVYSRALSVAQIREIYEDPLGIIRLAEPTAAHSIQGAAAATPQVIIIGWEAPAWLGRWLRWML